MKLGILGTGMIVKDLLTTIDKLDIEKMYILGTPSTKEETEKLAKEYGIEKCFYDYDEMLASDIDTVYVALPNFLHYSFSKKALEAGKHVICEKPVTSNYTELKELKAIAGEKKLILVEAMNIHYLPAYKALKEHIKDLGSLKIVSLNYSQYSSRYDAFKEGIVLPAFDPTKSGGALMDINVYNIHTVVGLFGKPKRVNYNANIERNIDTSGILTLDYGTFKAVCIGAKDCKAPIMSTYQGDKGNIIVKTPVNSMRKFELSDNQGNTQEFNFDEKAHRLSYEFKEFIEMINNLDFKKAEKMLEVSSIASELMEEARKQAGVVFTADK